MFKTPIKLRTYLISVMVLVVTLPVFLLSLQVIWQGVVEGRRTVERNQLLANWVGFAVEAELARQRGLLEAELQGLSKLTRRELGPTLARSVAGPLGPMVMVDGTFRPLAGPLPYPLTRGALGQLLEQIEGELATPTLVSNWSRGAFWVAPVQGRDYQGYVVVAAHLDQVKGLLEQLPLAEGEWVALAGDDRLIMAVAGLQGQGPALLGQPVDGELAARFSSSQVHQTPYSLEVWVGRYETEAPQVRTTLIVLTVGFLAFVVAIFLLWQLTGPLVRWLEGVTTTLRRGEVDPGRLRSAVGIAEFHDFEAALGNLLGRVSRDQERYISASQEVTARTARLAQASIDLVQSRATLYSVIESITNGLVLLTPDGRLRYVNRHAELLLGLTEPFYPGRLATDFYQALQGVCLDPVAAAADLERSIADNRFRPIFMIQGRDGQVRHIRCRTFAIRSNNGADLGLGHLLTDVTQEQELDRLKSELIANVSHELRTPLTSILASSSSLLRPEVQWSDDLGQEFLRSIVEEAHTLQELIESLLDMSKMEAGVFHLERTPYPVERLFERVVSRAQSRWPDWRFEVEVEAGLPVVAFDVRQVERLLFNLIENAVKYAGRETRITLTARAGANGLRLEVRDYGEGVDPAELGAIFGRFYRGQGEVAKRSRGSGLGLAICRGIATAHGGEIWAENAPGGGMSFIVSLPSTMREG